jgi:hypothetical protein
MGSEILRAQQRPQQVEKQAGGHDAAEDELGHGVSHPVAADGVGRHEPEEADAERQQEDVDHGAPRGG